MEKYYSLVNFFPGDRETRVIQFVTKFMLMLFLSGC
jgi:hypothetical protein